MLLLARIGMDDTHSPVNLDSPPFVNESVVPVPGPPPTLEMNTEAQEELLEALQRQQDLTERLEDQLSQQQGLVRELEQKLQEQRSETQIIATRLDAYERSVNTLTSQQNQLAGIQHDTDKTQASLLWVGAGLALVVLVGGAVVLLILVVLVAFQARSRPQGRSGPIIYTADVPPPSYPYYQQEFLPPPRRPRRVQAQDIYNYD